MATYDARPSAFTQLTTTSEWEALLSMAGVCAAGIDATVGNAMNPTLDTSGRNAVIDTGNVLIKGQLWRCDAPVNTAIPAASAQNRIDRLVIRLTRGASTSATVVAPAVVTGTPSGSPTIPALTQTPTGIWEFPVSHWTSTSAGALTGLVDDRRFYNDPWHDMRPLQNGFSGTIASRYPPQYRFGPDCDTVQVTGYVACPGSGGPDFNVIPFYTMPNAYRPTNQTNDGHRWAAGMNTNVNPIGVSITQVRPDGTMVFRNMPTSGMINNIMSIYGEYPLDDVNGYVQT